MAQSMMRILRKREIQQCREHPLQVLALTASLMPGSMKRVGREAVRMKKKMR